MRSQLWIGTSNRRSKFRNKGLVLFLFCSLRFLRLSFIIGADFLYLFVNVCTIETRRRIFLIWHPLPLRHQRDGCSMLEWIFLTALVEDESTSAWGSVPIESRKVNRVHLRRRVIASDSRKRIIEKKRGILLKGQTYNDAESPQRKTNREEENEFL